MMKPSTPTNTMPPMTSTTSYSQETSLAWTVCGSGGRRVPQAVARRASASRAAAGIVLGIPTLASAHGGAAPEPSFPGVLLQWRFEPLVLAGVLAGTIGWLFLVRRVRRRHSAHPYPAWRSAAFLGGLIVLAVALTSPIEAYEGELFSVHMLQHMLLELVAAPLLLLGAPATLALRAASTSVRGLLLAVLHSRAVAAVSFPLLAWILFAAVNGGWHSSRLYNDALEIGWLHDVQHLTFLGAALLFWWPVIGADPSRWRLP